RGDLAEATARFARVRQDVPNHPAGFTGGALALRDGGDFAGAEALLDEAMQRFPDEPGPVIDYAWVAHMRRDWPEAALRWQRVRERCATYPVGYTAGAAAQRELGRLDDAAALLEMAVARFPAEPGPLVEHAWFANHRRDWQAAIGLWEAVRRRFPAQIAAYIGGAQALREAGRLGDADALLATATERFPNDPGVRIEHAALASRRREWLEAAGRWDQVRARFPDHPASYTGAAQALREQRRFAEAGAVLEEALQRFPGDPGVRSEYAWLAQIAGDWPEATRRWQEMRERHPDHAVGYTSGAVSLREQRRFDEAEALLAEALVRFPGERVPLVEHAWLATSRRDWALAARRWEEVRRRHPELAEGYLRGAQALATMWQHEAAETLLAEGMTRFPQEGAFATEYAWIAYHRHEFEDAVRRFAELRDRFPAIIAGYTGGAMALRNLFRLGEAEALLEEAARRFPDDPKIPFEHAQLPMFHPLRRERDPEEALRRLAALRERFPDFEEGYVVALRYLREADRSAEGDTLAEAGLARLPDGAALVVEYSNNARERADWAEAVRRFETARSRFPGDPGGAIGLAASLSAAGRHDEAEQVAREATERFPSVPAAFNEFAWAAARRDDWAMALARWTEAQRHFPDEQDFAHRIFEARLRLAEGPDRAEPSGRVFRPKLRDVHHGKKMDDEIRQILRRRAFDRLYWPHRAVVVVDGHAELYDEASRVIGADTRVTVLEFGVAH
ncbi:MAG TPA: tetratricopeptide repeat protein, partial [Stellaceae bacterium]